MFFFAIAKPNRGKSNAFFLANTVKYLSVDRVGKSNTALNWIGFFNLNREGKSNLCLINYTVKLVRPFALRALITRRPPGVLIRDLKPCVRALFILLGW